MFQTGFPSIIRTSKLHIQRQVFVRPILLSAASAVLKKGTAFPLEAWSGPERSRTLRFPDFMTTAQDSGKVVSLTHRPLLPPSVRGGVDPRAIVRSEGFYINEKFQ